MQGYTVFLMQKGSYSYCAGCAPIHLSKFNFQLYASPDYMTDCRHFKQKVDRLFMSMTLNSTDGVVTYSRI